MQKINNEEDYNGLKNQDKLTLVKFSATWCGPCKQIKKYVEKMATENEFKDVNFVEIDIDECEKFEDVKPIKGVPTFKMFKNGELLKTLVAPDMSILRSTALKMKKKNKSAKVEPVEVEEKHSLKKIKLYDE